MTLKRILLWSVFVDFSALTGYAIYQHGILGFVNLAVVPLMDNAWGLQLLADFVLALGFAVYWMTADARSRGTSAWPFVALTACLGSLGPLAYAVRRPSENPEPAQVLAPEHQHA